MPKNIETRSLQCELTASEFMDRSKSLAVKHGEQTRLENERAQLNGKINDVKNSINKLSRIIEAGKENREIECEWIFDYERTMKTLVRRDTGEIIESDKLTQDEMQMELV